MNTILTAGIIILVLDLLGYVEFKITDKTKDLIDSVIAKIKS